MDDAQIRQHIEELVAEEHRLWDDEAAGGSSAEDSVRLARVKVTLDELMQFRVNGVSRPYELVVNDVGADGDRVLIS